MRRARLQCPRDDRARTGSDSKLKASIEFYSLATTEGMSANFIKPPRELRERIYELCLLHHESIGPDNWLAGYSFLLLCQEYDLLLVNSTVPRPALSNPFELKNRAMTSCSSCSSLILHKLHLGHPRS